MTSHHREPQLRLLLWPCQESRNPIGRAAPVSSWWAKGLSSLQPLISAGLGPAASLHLLGNKRVTKATEPSLLREHWNSSDALEQS